MEVDLWQFERQAADQGFTRIAGVDEAGRGPLAGPVVAAAVVLPAGFTVPGVTDSKALTPRKRSLLFDRIYDHAAAIGVGIVDPVEIQRINILQAARLAMGMAVQNLRPRPDCLLIDGTFPIEWHGQQHAIPKGDARSISIAAASIVAKVSRDRLMQRYDADYPQYGFARHKGYPTQAHRRAIQTHGCCPIHRRGFKGVREYLPSAHGARRDQSKETSPSRSGFPRGERRRQLGQKGEAMALDYLKSRGYRIVEHNHRNPMGEIDIIAKDKRTLVFVEVKTRGSHGFGNPKYAITRQKQRKLSLTALYYLKATRQMGSKARFDVVAICSGTHRHHIEIVKNAFDLVPT